MKKLKFLVPILVIVACFLPTQVNMATADTIYFDADLCSMTVSGYFPNWGGYEFPSGWEVNPGPSGWLHVTGDIPGSIAGQFPPAPAFHEDGRLNFRVCRAPLAVYMNEDGSIEVWSTDEEGMFASLTLVASATAEEIAAALAEAAAKGEDVVIAGADGYALIAKADGTLKAELIGEYGFDFMPDGTTLNGWGEGFEPFDPDSLSVSTAGGGY